MLQTCMKMFLGFCHWFIMVYLYDPKYADDHHAQLSFKTSFDTQLMGGQSVFPLLQRNDQTYQRRPVAGCLHTARNGSGPHRHGGSAPCGFTYFTLTLSPHLCLGQVLSEFGPGQFLQVLGIQVGTSDNPQDSTRSGLSKGLERVVYCTVCLATLLCQKPTLVTTRCTHLTKLI